MLSFQISAEMILSRNALRQIQLISISTKKEILLFPSSALYCNKSSKISTKNFSTCNKSVKNVYSTEKNVGIFNKLFQQHETSMYSCPVLNSRHVQQERSFKINHPQNNRSNAVMLWENVKELKSSPLPALVLGFSGLLPFIAAPGYLIMSQIYLPYIATAQVAYGATILSFLGGVRWGATIPENSETYPNWLNLTYSVCPPLLAWVGLLLPNPYSLLTMMTGLLGAGYFDITLYGYPSWFKGLRFILTFVAILSLWSTFMCSFLLKSSDQVKQEEPEIRCNED